MKNLNIILFLIILGSYFPALATHIVGGELTYTHNGGNNYTIRLKVYRDCFNGQAPFDDPAIVRIYDASGNFLQYLAIPYTGSTNVPAVTGNPCLQAPANVCVEEAVYIIEANLPPIVGGYQIVYQRCCRNNTIINIVDPQDAGATYLATIPDPSVVTNNSSPPFRFFPPIAICTNEALNFDHSAIDVDGDSLAYSFCTPFVGLDASNPAVDASNASAAASPPYPDVVFSGIYSTNSPISASPALQINAITGRLTGTPTLIGQYVVGICVKEYRNGIFISETRRDFQFNVVECVSNVTANFINTDNPNDLPSLICNGLTVNFTNQSVNAVSYHWNFGDNTTLADTSITSTPSYTYPDTGSYNVCLVANPHTSCADTFCRRIRILSKLDITINPVTPQCVVGNTFDFSLSGNYANYATFDWTFANAIPTTSTQQSPQNVHFNQAGTWNVTATARQYQCVDVATTPVTIYPNFDTTIVLQPQIGCEPYTAFFPDLQTITGAGLVFNWNFGDGNTSTQQTPTHIYNTDGTYTVNLQAISTFCDDTVNASTSIQVLNSPEAGLLANPPSTSIYKPFISFTDNSIGAISCELDLGDGTTTTDCDVAAHYYADTGTYLVRQIVQNALGCADTLYITVRVEPEFNLFVPNAFTPNGDGKNNVFWPRTMGVKDYQLVIYDRWGEMIYQTFNEYDTWDGKIRNTNKDASIDVYTYKIFVRFINNKTQSKVGKVFLMR